MFNKNQSGISHGYLLLLFFIIQSLKFGTFQASVRYMRYNYDAYDHIIRLIDLIYNIV